MIYALLALQVADLATTLYVLRRGAGAEGNKLAAWLMARLGPELAAVLIKSAVAAIIWTLRDEFAPWAMAGMIVVYVLIVGNNLRFVMRSTK